MWSVVQHVYEPERMHHDETIFTVGNGYLCTRGSTEEPAPDQRRTTFVHGVFDPVPLFVTEPANLPDWTALSVTIDDEPFDLSTGEILEYRRGLRPVPPDVG